MLLCLRAWLGPFDWGIRVNSPLVAEGIFSVCVVTLLLLGGKGGGVTAEGKAPWLPLAAALSLIAFAFVWNLGDPFLADDYIMVHRASMRLPSLTLFFTPGGDGSFRPVTGLYFDFVSSWAGWEPWRWHLLDLARHVADCGLLFALVWILWRNSFLAFASAVLFGLNGARPEVAVWNGASCDSIAVFFVLAALLCVFRSPAARISFLSLAAANTFVALAILSKESAYAMPILLLAFALASGRVRQRPMLAALASTALLSAALFAYRLVLFRGPGGYVNAVTGRPQILSLKFVPTAKALLVRLWSILSLPLNWRAEKKELLLPAVLLACAVFLAARMDERLSSHGRSRSAPGDGPGVGARNPSGADRRYRTRIENSLSARAYLRRRLGPCAVVDPIETHAQRGAGRGGCMPGLWVGPQPSRMARKRTGGRHRVYCTRRPSGRHNCPPCPANCTARFSSEADFRTASR